MSVEMIQTRLLTYDCKTVLEQENALKEIAQEIALMTLSQAGFFDSAAFQGGTCLRILYGLERFSEDLDFVLVEPNKNFHWTEYVNNMHEVFGAYGYDLEVTEKKNLNKAIKMTFLKADSSGGLLLLKDNRTHRPKLQIKLEIDTNPPAGSDYDLKYLDFPLSYSVTTQNLPSLFASKCHDLLCRDYTKGRDWFDFVWYVSNSVFINFTLLTHAIEQAGPWKGKKILVTPKWFLEQLQDKINKINWDETRKDIERFVRPKELATLKLWSKDFFLSRVDKLSHYLSKTTNMDIL